MNLISLNINCLSARILYYHASAIVNLCSYFHKALDKMDMSCINSMSVHI